MVGNDRDAHGCIGSAGYTWCDALQQCIRPWETKCETPPLNVTRKKLFTCSLALEPATISAGQSVDVNYAVSTQDTVNFTYDCGSGVQQISSGGLISGDRLCQYTQPGIYTLSIYADGTPCAQKILSVLPAPRQYGNENCTANLTSGDIYSHNYDVMVYFDGFQPTDNVTIVCDTTSFTKGIANSGVIGMARQMQLNCHYQQRPINDFIDVYVGGMLCGNVTIPV